VNAIADIARRLQAASRWRRRFYAAGLGVCAALALPPLGLVPLAFAAFAGLLLLLQSDDPAKRFAGFASGWWFGFGLHVFGLYWIANALLIEWERVGWMIPFAVFGLSGFLAAFIGVATFAVVRAGAKGVAGAVALAIAWTLAEYARGHVLTGFPWNLIGSIWSVADAPLQFAALTGAYGLSAVTVLICALPATLRLRPALAAIGLLAALWAGGLWHLSTGPSDNVQGVALRLVQPVVPQELKWDAFAREGNLARTIALSKVPGWETRTHVIWAETATAFPIWGTNPRIADRRRQVADAAPPGGVLITGAVRLELDGQNVAAAYNSLHAIDGAANMLANYDKAHLVPFGEYVPLRGILPIERIVPGSGDFARGPGPETIAIPGLPPAGGSICYEIIFPGRTVDEAARPGFVLNVTNDSWFGYSAGPFQHFAAARLRAIEEGLPVVRAAGGGISGVIDARGRVRGFLGLEIVGVLDADLPQAASPTPYARWGDLMLAVLLAIFLAIWLRARKNGNA
jgi:apolipoprotein N-acyltransferase